MTSLPHLIAQAKAQLSAMTGLEPASVTNVARDGEGWRVTVELVELRRIPVAQDVLGQYEAELDSHGEVLTFHRKQVRLRAEVEGPE